MKKTIIIIISALLLTLLALATFYFIKEKEKKEFALYKVDLTTLNLQIKEKENCIKEKVLYHEEDGLKYYTSCLNNIMDNNGKDLKALLNSHKITFKDIFSTYKEEPLYFFDGGSKEYHYENLNIIKCNTIAGNRDVIIGSTLTEINEGYCSDNFEIESVGFCSFTKTYLVKEKKGKADDESTFILVSDEDGVEAIVKVKNYVVRQLTFGKEHAFTFDNNKELIKDSSIEEIFENYYLRTYSQREKHELENQPVCMPVSRDLIKKAYLFLSKDEQKLIENYFLAETDYSLIKELTFFDKKHKQRTLKNQEVIFVRFTKKVNYEPNIVVVAIDFKTKEVLGTMIIE